MALANASPSWQWAIRECGTVQTVTQDRPLLCLRGWSADTRFVPSDTAQGRVIAGLCTAAQRGQDIRGEIANIWRVTH